jgi:hypothetical protein
MGISFLTDLQESTPTRGNAAQSQEDIVLAGLDPAIHALTAGSKDIDARIKSAHDDPKS